LNSKTFELRGEIIVSELAIALARGMVTISREYTK